MKMQARWPCIIKRCFVYVVNKGLVRYDMVFQNPGYDLVEQNTYALPAGEPAHMAADLYGLYVGLPGSKGCITWTGRRSFKKIITGGNWTSRGMPTNGGYRTSITACRIFF